MTMSRRTFLSASAAALSAAATPVRARPLIALPDDIVERDGATITAISTPSPVVAMTFDDGPHPSLTPRLLDLLAARNLRATFYLIGNRVVPSPAGSPPRGTRLATTAGRTGFWTAIPTAL